MKVELIILNILLKIQDLFLAGVKPVKGRVQFITMESDRLEGDFAAIYNELRKEGYSDLHFCGMKFTGSIKDRFLYLINCLKQNYLCKKASVLILNDNNYIANCHKPAHLKVMQIWHSSGAIKKFGNQLSTRKYKIEGYDKILCTSPIWQKVYAEAFNTNEENIKPTGLPRNRSLLEKSERYKIHEPMVLYAPTFRGNSIDGIEDVDLDIENVRDSLPKGWMLTVKRHPLSNKKDSSTQNTYSLMAQSDILITDYSALILDYSLLNRPIILYAPDIEGYGKGVGLNIDLNFEFKGYIAYNESELIDLINKVIKDKHNNSLYIQRKFMSNDFSCPEKKIVEELKEWL